MVISIWCITNLIEKRYKYLEILMRKICLEEGLARDDIRRRFCEISKAYEVLHRTVQNFNEIYGKFVIIMSIIASICVLRVFIATVLSVKEKNEWLTIQNVSLLPIGFTLMVSSILRIYCTEIRREGTPFVRIFIYIRD
ncbi:hypothetical protein JTB14_022341 [Gonioctena quinquepunctata]|nr:hypothetical protein JTB14_022341 [Gonioctena quinquepunctata]